MPRSLAVAVTTKTRLILSVKQVVDAQLLIAVFPFHLALQVSFAQVTLT